MARPVNVILRWRRGSASVTLAGVAGRARGLGSTATIILDTAATILGSLTVVAANLDATSAAEYATRTSDADRASYLVSVLTAPVTVRIIDGSSVVRASATCAQPWSSISAGLVVPAPLPADMTVTSGGVPDANWKLQFVGANGRIVQASFGLATSAQQLLWSKTTFDTGSTGRLGAISLSPRVTSVSTTFDAFYAPSFALTALSNEDFPVVAKPAKSSSLATAAYIDPVYGTRAYRMTNYATDVPGATLTHLRHEYSRKPVWNVNNTRFLAQASNGYWHLFDASTFARLPRTNFQGALSVMAGDCEPIWHPTDPTKLWFNSGLIWYEKDVENDSNTILVNFSGRFPFAGPVENVWWKAEGRPSANGRIWGLMCTEYNEATVTNRIHGLITWDRQTDQIIGSLPSSAFGGTGAFPDHMSTSNSGNYVVPSWAFQQTLGTRAYTPDFSSYRILHPEAEHTDCCTGPNGEDIFVVTDYQSGQIRAVNMATGAGWDIHPLYPISGYSYAVHISGANIDRPGWCLISTYAETANEGLGSPRHSALRKLFAVELKPGGRKLNIAHTRIGVDYGGYFGECQASVNRDFTRIAWASNFGAGTNIDSYMIGLPSWALPST
ncbi:MAG: hypothetical protein ACK5XA_15640 [Tagaea sp.]